VNGGPGDDVLTDESAVQFYAQGLLAWFTSNDAATFFYDYEGFNALSGGAVTAIITSPASEFAPRGRFF
jgi:hypothetical protein